MMIEYIFVHNVRRYIFKTCSKRLQCIKNATVFRIKNIKILQEKLVTIQDILDA